MPIEGLPEVTPQLRRSDPLNDKDVRQNVKAGEELGRVQKFIRQAYAVKKPLGGFLGGLAGVLATAALFYQKEWLIASTAICSAASGALLAGGSSQIKSDAYEQQKNELLKERGLM